MKRIYFVRHGESEGNNGPIRQTAGASLIEKGVEQAKNVAKRCASIPTQLIITSTMTRAKETADYILGIAPQLIEYSDLFVERRRTSLELGKPKDDPQALEAEQMIKQNFALPGYRYLDEENFDDLKQRAKNALVFLANRTEESILVVTHGFFMRVILAYAVFGEELTATECQKFLRSFHMENTGITVLGYDETFINPWWVWTWNDHAHLG